MSSEPNKRHTQLDFKRLRGLWEPDLSSQTSAKDLNNSLAKDAPANRLDDPIAETNEPETSQRVVNLVSSMSHSDRMQTSVSLNEGQ